MPYMSGGRKAALVSIFLALVFGIFGINTPIVEFCGLERIRLDEDSAMLDWWVGKGSGKARGKAKLAMNEWLEIIVSFGSDNEKLE